MFERNEVRDALYFALERARDTYDGVGMLGFGVAHLLDGDGKTKELIPFCNLITTAGDQYYAQKAITLVAPANAAAPTAAQGMKLGTGGATAAAKSSTGASIVTYITGSNLAFDATFPSAAAVGGDGGWNATYKTTWAAGTATNASISEVAIINDQTNNANGSTAANTYARATFTAINKTASDSLAITWTHKFLGA